VTTTLKLTTQLHAASANQRQVKRDGVVHFTTPIPTSHHLAAADRLECAADEAVEESAQHNKEEDVDEQQAQEGQSVDLSDARPHTAGDN